MTPKQYLQKSSNLQKYLFFWKPQKYWNSKFWTPKNALSLRMYENIKVHPPPPPSTWVWLVAQSVSGCTTDSMGSKRWEIFWSHFFLHFVKEDKPWFLSSRSKAFPTSFCVDGVMLICNLAISFWIFLALWNRSECSCLREIRILKKGSYECSIYIQRDIVNQADRCCKYYASSEIRTHDLGNTT